ncbi:unnamed protein product (mitochondrion) [Plasmodiophora brassicae]|uniref:RRM domain-containing protein n=1 Tax=Plasmodiophora brassicae TaxID=37360 RepID=A0A3P3YF82_PLABS|nr:unnamed protein product [Plasmodiophora brassicae]
MSYAVDRERSSRRVRTREIPSSPSIVCRVLDVTGLTVDTTEEQLKAFLGCSSVDIPKNPRSGISMGYGYAYFSTTALASQAYANMHMQELNGNPLHLSFSASRHPDALDATERREKANSRRSVTRSPARRRSPSPRRRSSPARRSGIPEPHQMVGRPCAHYPNCKKGDRCEWDHIDADGRDARFPNLVPGQYKRGSRDAGRWSYGKSGHRERTPTGDDDGPRRRSRSPKPLERDRR